MKVKIKEDGTVNSSAGVLLVTADSCQCRFWKTMHLPCKHIFAVREQKSLSVFSSALIAERWKANYLQEAFHQKISSELNNSLQMSTSSKVQATITSPAGQLGTAHTYSCNHTHNF